jgi:alanine racemase
LNRPTLLEIDLKALDFNLKNLKSFVNSAKFYPVIKADAYGHGVEKIAKHINNKVDGFCVATSEEAINLRSFSKKPILDLEGPYDLADMKALIKKNIQFVIHSERQLNFFKKVKTLHENHPIWLKFDLGMNRLGFSIDEASKIFEEGAKKTNRITLMSHFFSFKGNIQQLSKFKDLEKQCLSEKIFIKKSLSNSGGMINHPLSQKDIVRPGISLFGSKINLRDKNIKLKPVMTLKSKLISIKNIEKGEKVGYDGTWQAKKRTKIGILPIGYGDGYPINLSNCGKVFLNGNLAPLIGKISMDMVAIDLSRIKKISYKDEVILWGKDHEVDTVAKYANNSPYSLMTGLTKRVKKVYKL